MNIFKLWILLPITLVINYSYQLLKSQQPIAQVKTDMIENDDSILLAKASYLSALEQKVIDETNKVRTNPRSYLPMLESYRQRFEGKKIKVAENTYLITQEGVKPVDEAIAFLKSVRPVGALSASKGMSLGARDHVKDQGAKGALGHDGSDGSSPFTRINRHGKWQITAAENISYGVDLSLIHI